MLGRGHVLQPPGKLQTLLFYRYVVEIRQMCVFEAPQVILHAVRIGNCCTCPLDALVTIAGLAHALVGLTVWGDQLVNHIVN